MKYACQMMQMRNSTTEKPAIVEEKVATAEGSMTNRIMFTEVTVAEEQDMAGNNMDFHKSRDEITRLVSNDNTGVLESEQQAQDIQKEDLKRAAMQELRRRENNVDSEASNREDLKRRALEERRMNECGRHNLGRNLAGALLMRGRHPEHRGNEKKANVSEARAKDNSASDNDSKGATLQHKIEVRDLCPCSIPDKCEGYKSSSR